MIRHTVAVLLAVIILGPAATAAECQLAVLGPQTWDQFAPQGKEVDAIYGDYVLRNDQIVAVVAQPLATRNANMTVREVGGYIIDLTERHAQNDQLSAYFPGGGRYELISPSKLRVFADGQPAAAAPATALTAKTISIELDAEPAAGRPSLTVRYTLTHDANFIAVETIHRNATDKPITDELNDAIRADRSFKFGFDATTSCFWADDEWFRQAYGILAPGYEIKSTGQRGSLLQLIKDGSNRLTLEPNATHTIARKVFPGGSLLAVLGSASEFAEIKVGKVSMQVNDSVAVKQASVTLSQQGKVYAGGRTNADGRIEFLLPAGTLSGEVVSIDGRRQTVEITGGAESQQTVQLGPASYVQATITDANGKPTPAKVSFTGKDGTKDPDWGPDTGEIAVKNVYYTHDGVFRQVIAPGTYDVIVSYGPEHDAVFTTLTVSPSDVAQLKATLRRTVDTAGWISADFHSHSTPSGDNTSSQLGRVLNLLCEHIEFAPCTEHNRIDTYVPHLKRLGVEKLMATCTGMELTGSPLPVNHQNAFPLIHKPHTQDGGAPVRDDDPVAQIERLAFWDNKSDKLVQMNHPNLPQILGDRNTDSQPDGGFERMFGFVDVIEIHPPQGIFVSPQKIIENREDRNPIYHWMQMLNLGYRLPGVINTDSHYNYHESGFFRNFIQSSTDDPASVSVMEMVHSAESGHVVVSTGPFLSVTARASGGDEKAAVGPGGNLAAPDGRVELAVRVQCPNWFDVNRVQVFVNGRPNDKLNFTRRATPMQFQDGVMKFEAQIPVELKSDAHVIVATIGEGLQLGPVLGPDNGKLPPVAVSNPVFVDVDGGGFKPNGDLLDVPLPINVGHHHPREKVK